MFFVKCYSIIMCFIRVISDQARMSLEEVSMRNGQMKQVTWTIY